MRGGYISRSVFERDVVYFMLPCARTYTFYYVSFDISYTARILIVGGRVRIIKTSSTPQRI